MTYHTALTRQHREKINGHKSFVLWFTGLSGSGKSSLAYAVEEMLYLRNCHTYVLDGDRVRQGLCCNLGFSVEDRHENIRRIAETAKLMVDSGLIVMTSLISPFRLDRERARALFPAEGFIEIYCSASLAVCESRDVKGHYIRARSGDLKEFTGISSPYEPPLNPELLLDTSKYSLEICVEMILNLLLERGLIH